MSAYPVQFTADYAPERNRLTTFFRLILVIPHYIVSIVYGIGAFIALVIAWFALLFTGRYPRALYDFVAGVLRFNARYLSYALLLTDDFPSFGLDDEPSYPVRLHVAPAQESYNRLTVLFRSILAIPIFIVQYVAYIVIEIIGFVAWLVIVITGRQPQGLQDVLAYGIGYCSWSNGYVFLLTDRYPPFTPPDGQLAGVVDSTLPPGGAPVAPERPAGAPPARPPTGSEAPAVPPPSPEGPPSGPGPASGNPLDG